MPSIKPPEDKTITTLWVGGVTGNIDETDLQEFFYQFGEIAAINVVQKNSCAFVQFTRRDSAEFAAQKCFGKLDMKVYMLFFECQFQPECLVEMANVFIARF